MTTLSICIPTYNRAEFLPVLLDSIFEQNVRDSRFEVVISDNASVDGTEEVVRSYQRRYPNIIYYRSERNLGADSNYLKVVSLANGSYCWLMGSDDRLEPGSLNRVINVIDENFGVTGMSLNRLAYTYKMDACIYERPVCGGALRENVLLEGAEKIFGILGEYFGYLSGQVIRRDLWNEVLSKSDVSPYLNAYVHVFIIAKMLQLAPSWYYVSEPCVGWRSGNDSFLSEGAFHRMRLDVVGYEQIAGDVFGRDSNAYREINRVVCSVHVWYAVLGAKLNGLPPNYFKHTLKLLLKYYWRYPIFWIRTFPLFVIPGGVLRGFRAVYRRTLKTRRVKVLKLLNT